MNANQQWYLDFGGLPKGTSWRQNTMSICDLVASLEVMSADRRPTAKKNPGGDPLSENIDFNT